MSDAITRYEPASLQVDIASELPAIFQLSKALTKAGGFIPQHLKNEGEIAAVILAGRELGLPPMTALRSLSLIKGKVTLAAEVQLALMVRAGAKFKWLSDGSNGVAKLELTRPGQEPYVSTFTMEDAQRAGLSSNDNYRKHPGAMLRARAVSAASRAYMPDVLAGVYVPGELEDEPQNQRHDQRVVDAAAVGANPDTGEIEGGRPLDGSGAAENPIMAVVLDMLDAARTGADLDAVRKTANDNKKLLGKGEQKLLRERFAQTDARIKAALAEMQSPPDDDGSWVAGDEPASEEGAQP